MLEQPLVESRWPLVLNMLKERLGERDFGKWIKPLRLLSFDQGRCTVEVPNTFIRNWVLSYYDNSLKESIASIFSTRNVELDFVLSLKDPMAPSLPAEVVTNGKAAPVLRDSLNPNYTFQNFIVGSSNQFAHAASGAAAESPGQVYNPLFIYGGVGLGKTHLLHAIGLQIASRSPGLQITYLSSERFINDLINCLRLKKMDDFRRRYRNCDVLLVDDIQFIAGKERSQEEFFHTFNTLYELKKQIVLTSDKPPKDIQGLEERLCSRFAWGLIADITPPELETRTAILKKKAEDQNIELPDDVALFIAGAITNNIRELEGSLIRLNAYASLMGGDITLDFAKEIFKDLIKAPRSIDIEDIQKGVARAFNIKALDLCSQRKFKYIALPRQIAMYLCRRLTAASLPEIGQRFGGKDHTTVLHAVRKVENSLIQDTTLKNTIESLEKTIRFGSC